jgi:NAD(P)H-flavin reductase
VPTLALPVADVRVETPRTRVVRVLLSGRAFDFRPGQYVSAGLHGQPLRKPYSIACSVEQSREMDGLELLVQVGAEGSAGAHLGTPAKGDVLDVSGPKGDFRFPRAPRERHFLFVAGGTGIAPLRAMLWHELAAFPGGRTSLVYSARAVSEFAYAAELRELAARGRILLWETVTRDDGTAWTGERGRMRRQHVERMVATPDTLCFVCGPQALVGDVTGWLRDMGISTERIRAEGWT